MFWCMFVSYFSAGLCNVMHWPYHFYHIDIQVDMQDKAS
jgi:hypothetical protein